jgi:glycosyltransferase involved in cell wall biosynthesis
MTSVPRSPVQNLPTSKVNLIRGLKVCFVAGTLGQGGAERQLFYMLQALKEAGAHVKVISLSQGEFWETPIRKLGIDVSYVGSSQSRLKRLIQIIHEVRSFNTHIVQAQHFYVNLYATVAARLSGCHEIGAIRNNLTSEVADVNGWLGRASFGWPRMLACNSKAALGNLVKRGVPKSRLFFLPNVIDSSHFSPANAIRSGDAWPVGTHPTSADPIAACPNSQWVGAQMSTPPSPQADSPVILGIGRLVPQKRFDLFLHALALVNLEFPVKGIIAGDGPLRAELEAQVKRLGLAPGTVKFLGRTADALKIYRQGSLLLLTSDHEGTPNVILEAMACRIPVVATRVGDVPELLGEGTHGRLVAPGNLNGLVSAIVDLLSDHHACARYANDAYAYVQSQYSQATLKERLTNLYSQTLNK